MGGREESLSESLLDREVAEVERLCRPYFTERQAGLRLHGVGHLRKVARLAGLIAMREAHDRCTVRSAVVAGFLHDIGRVHDGHDPEHGRRSGGLARTVLAERFSTLPAGPILVAIEGHADGRVSAEPVAAALWDADRLTLGRAGITPRLDFFSTAAGRDLARQAGPAEAGGA